MLDSLVRYGVAIYIAVTVAYSSWARGGSSPFYVWALPWLSLGIAEMVMLQPPRAHGDTPASSLRRLVRGLLRDPVTYLGAALVGFLTIQWLNGPRELAFDSFKNIWEYGPAPMESMPSCVDQGEAWQVLLWGVVSVVVVLAVRHGLKPSARMFLLRLMVVNGSLLSVFGFVQLFTQARGFFSAPVTARLFWYRPIPVYFFSTFGYPNHAGAFFVLLTAVNAGLLIHAFSDPQYRHRAGWLGLTFMLNAAGVIGSLSRAAMVLGALVVLFGLVYGLVYLRRSLRRNDVIRVFSAVAVMLIVVAVFALVPSSPLCKELKTIDVSRLADVYKGDRADLCEAAMSIWKDYPWVGVGGWGFRRYVGLYMGEEKAEYLKNAGRANVHNDPLQFLCEHGAIGFGLMSIIVLILVAHVLSRAIRVRRRTDDASGAVLSWFDSVSPLVVMGLAGCAAVFVHSTIDLPFRSIAVTLLWLVVLASLPAFLPVGAAPAAKKKARAADGESPAEGSTGA